MSKSNYKTLHNHEFNLIDLVKYRVIKILNEHRIKVIKLDIDEGIYKFWIDDRIYCSLKYINKKWIKISALDEPIFNEIADIMNKSFPDQRITFGNEDYFSVIVK